MIRLLLLKCVISYIFFTYYLAFLRYSGVYITVSYFTFFFLFQQRKNRNKVFVGEPAEGPLDNLILRLSMSIKKLSAKCKTSKSGSVTLKLTPMAKLYLDSLVKRNASTSYPFFILSGNVMNLTYCFSPSRIFFLITNFRNAPLHN